MTAPLVSVAMANHNGAEFLGPAIRSLKRQTVTSWELIIADDASSDDSIAEAKKAANGDPRITIIGIREKGGPGAARNRALDAARGDWIAVFDSDDLMAPLRLEILLARARADRAALVADNLLVFSEHSPKPRPYLKSRLGRSPRWMDLYELIESSCLYSRMPDLGFLKPMIRAELISERRARYDERLRIGEDFFFLASLLANGQRLRLEPSATYLYRKHEGSLSYRMNAADICALIAADDAFAKRCRLDHRETQALSRRRRTLDALLVYDTVIHAIKQGRPARGAGLAVRHPRIWPLLTRPLAARLKRVGQALGAT
jgi:succinoglycan biosynthesis protein ExoO